MFDWRELRRWGIDEVAAARRAASSSSARRRCGRSTGGRSCGASPSSSPRPPSSGPCSSRGGSGSGAEAGRSGGRAALPHGRRLHARLGVLEAARRDVRLRVALLRAHSPATRPRSSTRRPSLLNEMIVAEDRPRWDAHARGGAGRGGRASHLEFRIRTADGQVRWIDHVCSPVTGRGRPLPRPARLEPGRDREEALGGASCETPSPRSSGCASGSRPTTPTCGSRSSRPRASRGSSAAATSCATSSPGSSRWRPRRARSSSRARRASARSSSPTRSTT